MHHHLTHASRVYVASDAVAALPLHLPSRLVRQVAVGFTVTIICTTDGACFQWGSLAGIPMPPGRVPELREEHVLAVAVGAGRLEPDTPQLERVAAAAKHIKKKSNTNNKKQQKEKKKSNSSNDSAGNNKSRHTQRNAPRSHGSSGGGGGGAAVAATRGRLLSAEERAKHFVELEEIGTSRRYDDEDHICVVTDAHENNLWTWGGNSHGQLGRGHRVFSGIPRPLSFGPDHHERVASVTCGHKFTIAITESNHVWGFGVNDSGQLGLATMRNEYARDTQSLRSLFYQGGDRSSKSEAVPLQRCVRPAGLSAPCRQRVHHAQRLPRWRKRHVLGVREPLLGKDKRPKRVLGV